MPPTTAWERHLRRREVIRLRYGQGFTAAEISEELGWSEATIHRDLQRIRKETAKLGEPEFVREWVKMALQELMEHEWTDLRRAEREEDERAKHRAKSSARQTVSLIADLFEQIRREASSRDGAIDQLSPETQQVLAEAAENEVEGILGE